MKSTAILVTNEHKFVRVLGVDERATVVTTGEGEKMRVFHFLPGQRYSTGEPIFTEGFVDHLGNIRLDTEVTR